MQVRKPSIHITESHLAVILRDIFEDLPIANKGFNELAKEIARRAKAKTLVNRSVSISNDKLERKINMVLKASDSDTDMLANLIYHMRRRKSKLYTTKKIDKESKDYPHLKELAKVCLDFCNTFGFDKRKGFLAYLEIAIPKINSSLNYINKLVNLAEKVYQTQEAINLIAEDDDKDFTLKIHDTYMQTIGDITGIYNTKHKDPIAYSKFIEVKEAIKESKVSIDLYLKAQFQGLSWTDNFPEPNQLVGDNAISRLNKYLYENKVKISKGEQAPSKELKNALLNIKKNRES